MDIAATILICVSILLFFQLVAQALDSRVIVKLIETQPSSSFLNYLSLTRLRESWISLKVWVTRGDFRHYAFRTRYGDFALHGTDIIDTLRLNQGLMFKPHYLLEVADPAVVKTIVVNRTRFIKPIEPYRPLSFFGRNIVGSEGEDWKRYRKISAPAFSERNTRLAWDRTVQVMSDLFNDVWGTKEQIVLDNALDLTMPITLFVTSAAAFGKRISWTDSLIVPPGHKMTFKQALHTACYDMLIKIIVPKVLLKYGPARFRTVGSAYEELETYMREMIHKRRLGEVEEERSDLLSNLLDASEEGFGSDGKAVLSDRELLGNVFIFLFAGHETTSHTLGFALGLLALYPDEQEKLFQHVTSVLSDGRIPRYEDIDSLSLCTAVLYETLRFFPPVVCIPKRAAEDTILSTTDSAGQKVTIPVPKGTNIVIHVPGLHHHPQYWKNPEQFNPERFLGDWPREAFIPFSSGARSCLGRRFAEAESVAVLSMLVSRYKITVTEYPQFAGETFDERKARVLKTGSGMSLYPKRVPLTFTRR